MRASNTIVAFLKNPSPKIQDTEDVYARLDAFSELGMRCVHYLRSISESSVSVVAVQTLFMSLLFDYRNLFHSMAADALLPGTAASTIVCWVDVILASMGEAVVELAYGRKIHTDESGDAVRKHCDDNNLRAAAQLPCTWPSHSFLANTAERTCQVRGTQFRMLSPRRSHPQQPNGWPSV